MFVLLFAYVFGGAIPIQGVNYREFLMAGIFAQTVVFGVDAHRRPASPRTCRRAIIDRFRSLPMSRSAVLVGRTTRRRRQQRDRPRRHVGHRPDRRLADPRRRSSRRSRRSCCCCSSPTRSPGSWPWSGWSCATPEVVNNAGFIVIFPLTFIANTFVPIEQLPARAQGVRRVEPGLVGDPRRPAAVRQPAGRRTPSADRLVAAAPGALHAALGV